MATLYKWPEAWAIPSLSPSCIQVEAYLRMSGATFSISSCATATNSPTGTLPAVDADGQFSKTESSEFAAARACIALARRALKDLDAPLGASAKAEVLAFTALIEQRLDTATEYSIWVEPKGYKTQTQVAYSHQPFPLRYIMPWNARREVLRRWPENTDAEALYSGAVDALSALADKLRSVSGTGPFLMGAKPCSLDALVFGHLVFYQRSPCAAEVLKTAVTGHPVLVQYITYILDTFFSTPVPIVSQPGSAPEAASSRGAAGPSDGANGAQWSDAAQGKKKPTKPAQPTAAEREFQRKSWWWLGGAAVVVFGYILFSGRYIKIEQLAQLANQGLEDIEGEEEDEDLGDDEGDDPHNDRED